MNFRTILAVFVGQFILKISVALKLGSGATWPGEVALKIDPELISKLISKDSKVIVVAGTNGKTTTSKMIVSMLGKSVIHNETGANLLNGIASVLVKNYFKKPAEYYVFEVDENYLAETLKQVQGDRHCHPDEGQDLNITVVLLNLFRDQLDRYGELDKIAKDWMSLTGWSNLIVNGDDPQLAWLGKNLKGEVFYFGLEDKSLYLSKMQHATDSIFCPNCGKKLIYSGVYFSHLGDYRCVKCGFDHPKVDKGYKGNGGYMGKVEGVYNYYNVLAALLTAEVLGIKNPDFSDFKPAFGRGEEIGKVKILLSKNPAGFNESLRTVIESSKKSLPAGRQGPLLLALNDRIPDGRDISWIWDVDFENLTNYRELITVTGDRVYDLALRLKYAGITNMRIEPNIRKAVTNQTWILATYSAMLDIRKELTGRKIL